jgi:hypothetical protein
MEQLQNNPIVFTSLHEEGNHSPSTSGDPNLESWLDLVSIDTKYTIAFWFESFLLCHCLLTLFSPNWHRHQVRFKAQWNGTEENIPVSAYNWYFRRSTLGILTHSLFWLLYNALRLKPAVVYAHAMLPFGILCLSSIFSDEGKQRSIAINADIQGFIIAMTPLVLFYTNSPYLMLAEKISNAIAISVGLLFYLSPTLISRAYNVPPQYLDNRVMVHHMNYFGYSILFMSTLGSALVWQEKEDDDASEVTLLALATSLLLSVILNALMIADARLIFSSMIYPCVCYLLFLAVGTILLIF